MLLFIFIFLYLPGRSLLLIPVSGVAVAVILFANFCYQSWRQRIRKKVDEPMKVSIFSVIMMVLPLLFLVVILALLLLSGAENSSVITAYGFIIFFGWITAIILGMTFKTLPFIVWHKVYHKLVGKGKTPNPKDLFSNSIFKWMSIIYLGGFVLFTVGILLQVLVILQSGAVLLLLTSFLYNWNVVKLLMHKPVLL